MKFPKKIIFTKKFTDWLYNNTPKRKFSPSEMRKFYNKYKKKK